ncbi:MAG: zf-HC2 domain-containing protein [Candidatus Aminicenantes bacterium]|nr:MAG: zf-HC2 domain-containing protein [Candidatus Aminicenantes bacterium]
MKGSKMDCKRVEDLMSMYIENELPKELHREISLHLEQCDQCQQLREKVEELIGVFPELEEEVPFFLKNRLYYIPESQEIIEKRRESQFYYLKWLAAAIGTVVLFLNLFYFTNIYPPAKRVLHSMMARIKTFTVETGAFIEKVKESDGAALFSFLKKDADIEDKVKDKDRQTGIESGEYPNIENHKLEIEKKIEKGGQNG